MNRRRSGAAAKAVPGPSLTSLKTSGIESVSVWGIVLLGLLTGFLSAFLGVGAGFIRMPAMLYLLECRRA